MLHNKSGKFECVFSTVTISDSSSVLLKGLEGTTLGVWSAHAEGRFFLPEAESNYQIPGKYSYAGIPSKSKWFGLQYCDAL